MEWFGRRPVLVTLVCIIQLALVGFAVADRLSARLTGDEYLLRVGLVDPIDPFRGAYVALSYPDLDPPPEADFTTGDEEVFILLERSGEFWVAAGTSEGRPPEGPFIACSGRDWRRSCGIESWFAPQHEAKELERAVANGDAVARVRIDSRGNAALVAIETG